MDETLEEVINCFNGDDKYIEHGSRSVADKYGSILVDSFAHYICKEGPQDSYQNPKLNHQKVADMLQHKAADPRRPAEVDVKAFVQAFRVHRDKLRIHAGIYNGPNSTNAGVEKRIENPIMPGISANQTKSSLQRRTGDRKVMPYGYNKVPH